MIKSICSAVRVRNYHESVGAPLNVRFSAKIRHASARRARGHSAMLLCAILFLAGGLLLAGCANSTEVKIDSLAKPKAEYAISYQFHNANPVINTDLFQYKEAVGIVSPALSVKGTDEAPPGTHADLVVDLAYGISPPQRRYKTESKQIFGNVPGESTPVLRTVGVDPAGSPINQTIYEQGPSTIGEVGSRDGLVALDIYEKHLRLAARENKVDEGGKPAPQVWTVDVISEGESRDLRKALPILAAAAIDNVGKDSHGQKVIRRKDTDKSVVFVKQGM